MDIMGAIGGRDPYWSSVVLLEGNYNAVNGSTVFVDQSPTGENVSQIGSSVTWTTSNHPPGLATSINFPAALITDGLTNTTRQSAFAFPSDYTIEFYVYLDGLAQAGGIIDFRTVLGGSDLNKPAIATSGGSMQFAWNATVQITGSLPANLTWAHYALCRSGNTVKAFLNGTQTGSNATDSTSFSDSALTIGNTYPLNTNALKGKLAGLRVTQAARYTGTFTPPNLPLPISA